MIKKRQFQVLMVEDNPDDIQIAQEVFDQSVYRINLIIFDNGRQALEYLEDDTMPRALPDLIFLDLKLPGLSGLQILKKIKANERLKKIPVIIFSNSLHPDEINQSYAEHAACFIEKPDDLVRFRKTIKCLEEFWFALVKLPL